MSYDPNSVLDALPARPTPVARERLFDFTDPQRLAAVVAAGLLVLVQFADLLTTRALLATGRGVEANPLARALGGLGNMGLAKLVIATALALMVARRRHPSLHLVMALYVGVGCYLAVVLSNVMVLHLAGGL